MNDRTKRRRQGTEEEDREQALEARRRAIENGNLADAILQALTKYILHLTSKDPATLTHEEAEFLWNVGEKLMEKKKPGASAHNKVTNQ